MAERLNTSQIEAAIAYVNSNHNPKKGTKAGYLAWYCQHFHSELFEDLTSRKKRIKAQILDYKPAAA
ncbi:MAG TPA: hypothetical protein VNJ07_12450 [Chitinophagales bacterium]|nr:hypothetical protein [Chitinophagales bacterium]